MRSILASALGLALGGCGSAEPPQAREGPRIEASLAATWPAEGPARQTAFSPDGRLLATSDATGILTIRDTRSWKVVERFQHPNGATTLNFGKDPTQLFSAGYDGAIREWDLDRRAMTRTRTGPQGTVWTIDISPDGATLASAGEDRVIRLWRLGANEPPAALRGHERNIWEVSFSPDGKLLASGSFDATARLWSPQSTDVMRSAGC